MADPDTLVVSGGGSIAVGTDELFAAVAKLRSIEAELAAHLRDLAAIDRLVASGQLSAIDAPAAATVAERAMDDATRLLAQAQVHSGLLGAALSRSADAYGLVERASKSLAEAAAARIAYALGFALPVLAGELMPVLVVLGLTAGLGYHFASEQDRTAAAGWLKKHLPVLSDPGFVAFVRLTVTSLDDFAGGAVHAPPGGGAALAATGLAGVASSAAVIVGIGGSVGLLKETQVTTTRASTTSGGTLPNGWEERADRVPHSGADNAPQVRIDRYSMPNDEDRFEVYVSGTKDFALGHDSQPWDMTSNMNGIAGGDPASVRAVEDAMKQAGVTPTSPVLFTGHSQGGLVTAIIAGSGEYNTRGLYTLGAPAGQASVPSEVPWIAVQHTNDIVPALSGDFAHSDPVLVERHLTSTELSAIDKYFPSHQLGAYESTAKVLDTSTEPRVMAVDKAFSDFTEGATPVESTTWFSVRSSD